MRRRTFLTAAAIAPAAAQQIAQQSGREYWLTVLTRVSEPVLTALSQRKLATTMPVEVPNGKVEDRRPFTYLEALGRTLAGIAPWLESGSEADLRSRYADLTRASIAAAVDPTSPDFMNFNRGQQPLVDAAFLALGILRAPTELWLKLDSRTRSQLIEALRSTRVIKPGFNNWLLFSATIEAFFAKIGESWDSMRVDYAVREHEQWYKGDGIYGDGPQFHWDYYNSYVIHPMLLAVLETTSKLDAAILARAKRYAAIEERLIAPDGSFPAIGRSLAYRCGAFHLLADMALRRQAPDVRGALTAVIRRTMEAPGTFDTNGWLQVGLCGHQPSIAESYISTGSLYLCSTALLPLGLPASDPFWTNPAQPWTSKRVWGGQDVAADHALQDNTPSSGRGS